MLNRFLKACLTSILAVLATGELVAQPPRARVREALVSIVVQPDNRAQVHARYEFTENPGAMSFEFLEQNCARVGPLRVESNGGNVPYQREDSGPWVRLHDTSTVDPGRSSLGYTITYDVVLYERESNIPIVLPLAVLTGRRRGDVIARIEVQLPAGARVTLPRMAPGGREGQLVARMAALPSAVRVRGATPNDVCAAMTAAPAVSGNFKLIFWALVATLALWVPTYLWWANRQQQAA